jgi:hypothetical protein
MPDAVYNLKYKKVTGHQLSLASAVGRMYAGLQRPAADGSLVSRDAGKESKQRSGVDADGNDKNKEGST